MSDQPAPIDSKTKLGFIGGGNMGKAIIEGLLKANVCQPDQIYVSHPSSTKSKKFTHLSIQNETEDNEFVVRNCDVIVLCVKPQILESVCKSLSHLFDHKKHLFVSICAGINVHKLEKLLGGDSNACKLRLARCTLNTAALIGSSCSVFSQNGSLSDHDKSLVSKLLSSVGPCMGEIKDCDMDAAMAVCSCGIAYMYVMAEAMADGGVKMGLTRSMALSLAMQTMKGAGELMQQQFGIKHPMQLKDEVCSPGGTTIQGVHELERNGFRNAVICAVEAATNRAKQF
jgi:pyrroline-5-carboxylate reductase